MGTVWDPFNRILGVTLSGNGMVATTGGITQQNRVYSTTSKAASSGKWYFEIGITTVTPNWAAGIGNANETFADGLGGTLDSVGFYVGTGAAQDMFINNAVIGTGGLGVASSSGDVLRVAWDSTNHLMWFSTAAMRTTGGGLNVWNNNVIGTANPNTGIGGNDTTAPQNLNAGPYYIIANNGLGDGAVFTLNVSGPFDIGTIPTGFIAWDPVGSFVRHPITWAGRR